MSESNHASDPFEMAVEDYIASEMSKTDLDEAIPSGLRVSSGTARSVYVAPVPEGWHLHHICRNRWCKNPAHLISVSPDDHRKLHARETFCD